MMKYRSEDKWLRLAAEDQPQLGALAQQIHRGIAAMDAGRA